MIRQEELTLNKDCEAVQIPSGIKLVLSAGSKVTVEQTLGGSYTVLTELGELVRISGKEIEALGKDLSTDMQVQDRHIPDSEKELEKLVWEQLKSCYDPEIPVNIVELGLVYLCHVAKIEEKKYKVDIHFTLTAPGCGMWEILKGDIQNKVEALPGVMEVNVEVVFDPPWDPGKMSEAAQLELGLF